MARAGVTGDTSGPVMRRELEPSPVWGCLIVAIPISPQISDTWMGMAEQGWGQLRAVSAAPPREPLNHSWSLLAPPALPHVLPELCKLFMPLAPHQSFFHTFGRLELLIHYLQSSLSRENSGEKFTEMY